MSTSTQKTFWNATNATSDSGSKNVDYLKVSSVNTAPIVSSTQVDISSDLIGCSDLESILKQQDIKCNDRFLSNHYSLLTVSHSPVLTKNPSRVSNFKNQNKTQCCRPKPHFRRKISNRSHTWNDAASSISSSSGPVQFRAATDGEKSPVNSILQSNENITDSLSVENIPRLNFKSNFNNLIPMTVDTKTNNDLSNKTEPIRNSTNNTQLISRSLSPDESYLRNSDSKSETKFPIKPEFTTLAPCKGRINLTILCQFSRITILLKEADNLRSMNNSVSNPFVRIQLLSNLPNGQNIPLFDSEVFPNNSSPVFDKSFSFNISPLDYYKRIVISTYHVQNNELESLGCMSFGIKKFQIKTQVSGWYYLLKEEIGYRKHLKAGFLSVNKTNSVSNSVLQDSKLTNLTNSNVGYQIIEVKLVKGLRGFGFTLCGGSPVYVSHVDVDSSAELAGIHPGDMIIKIDNFNVSQSSTEAVVRMFRMCPKSVKVTLWRSPPQLSYRPLPAVPFNMHNSKTYPCIRAQLLPRDQSLNLTGAFTNSNGQMTKPMDSDSGNSGHDFQWDNNNRGRLDQRSVHFNSNVTEVDKTLSYAIMKSSQSPNVGIFEHGEVEKSSIVCSNNFPTRPPGEGSSNPNQIYPNLSGSEIINRLQYQGHLKKVDFSQMSPNLEIYGPASLKEGNCLFPVHIYLFSQVLLVGQLEPDGHITVIKEPIYCSKICYANIPAFCYDEIILQYINEVGRKQFIYFQATNIKEWLNRIQRHMIYHCNWWMPNIA